MARLNEAPPQADSVDALKRRFIRQNRDLARINTQQSLRIRALEVDQARLQTENLALQEEVLRLQHQLVDTADNAQLSHLDRVKETLRLRLGEILEAVDELGNIKRPQPTRTANPSAWRPSVPMLRLAGNEPRMSTILEDQFQQLETSDRLERKSLRLSDQSIDSPELGPPPVAHFDELEPVKYDQTESVLYAGEGDIQDEDLRPMPLEMAINLETRRRRRSSKVMVLAQPDGQEGTDSEAVSGHRTSSKRKLSARDTDDDKGSAGSDMFTYTRRAQTSGHLLAGADMDDKPTTTDDGNRESLGIIKQERRILGNKSVNMSPKKAIVGKHAVQPADTKPDVAKVRVRRSRTSHSTQLLHPMPEDKSDELSSADAATLPATPAVDVLSPSPSEPSSLPKPHEANLEGLTRPSRRARAVTNYAEPSLNSKMRRPTRELVDAIYTKSMADGSASIKTEVDESRECDWKSIVEAASPLQGKAESQIPKPVSPANRSGSSAAISALRLVDRPKAVSVTQRRPNGARSVDKEGEELDTEQVKIRAEPTRARRHSTIASLSELSLGSSPLGKSSPPSIDEDLAIAGNAGMTIGGGRAASRRRSMLV